MNLMRASNMPCCTPILGKFTIFPKKRPIFTSTPITRRYCVSTTYSIRTSGRLARAKLLYRRLSSLLLCERARAAHTTLIALSLSLAQWADDVKIVNEYVPGIPWTWPCRLQQLWPLSVRCKCRSFNVCAHTFCPFAGDKRWAERAQLSSADANTAEDHDQFYRDHKLLLVLFRVLGVMPVTRSQPGGFIDVPPESRLVATFIRIPFVAGKITFSWKSLATAYSILFYVVTTTIVVIVGQERLEILRTTKKFDDKIYAIIFVIFLVPHFWIPFVGWGKCFWHQDLIRHGSDNVLPRNEMIVNRRFVSRTHQSKTIDVLFLSFCTSACRLFH